MQSGQEFQFTDTYPKEIVQTINFTFFIKVELVGMSWFLSRYTIDITFFFFKLKLILAVCEIYFKNYCDLIIIALKKKNKTRKEIVTRIF